jgi:hypothetical protein
LRSPFYVEGLFFLGETLEYKASNDQVDIALTASIEPNAV